MTLLPAEEEFYATAMLGSDGKKEMPGRSVRVFALHPSLVLGIPNGVEAIIRRHAAIEVRKAQRLYERSRDASLTDLFAKFDDQICSDYKGCFLYAIVRRAKPDVIVETGVANGVSSYSILQALEDNGHGSLYSIDLPNRPNFPNLPPGQAVEKVLETGFLVPRSLKRRWTLIIGDSKQELPKLFKELRTIDFFIHDSLHEYKHMMFEYNEAWPRLKRGGILYSDDISWDPAFQDFCRMNNLEGTIVERTEIGYRVKMGWVAKP